jgi:hypothetical protein
MASIGLTQATLDCFCHRAELQPTEQPCDTAVEPSIFGQETQDVPRRLAASRNQNITSARDAADGRPN